MSTVAQKKLSGKDLIDALASVEGVTSLRACYTTASRRSMNRLQRILADQGDYELASCTMIEGVDGIVQMHYCNALGDWPYWASLTYHDVGQALPQLMLVVRSADDTWRRFATSSDRNFNTYGSESSEAEKIELECEEMHPGRQHMWVPDFTPYV